MAIGAEGSASATVISEVRNVRARSALLRNGAGRRNAMAEASGCISLGNGPVGRLWRSCTSFPGSWSRVCSTYPADYSFGLHVVCARLCNPSLEVPWDCASHFACGVSDFAPDVLGRARGFPFVVVKSEAPLKGMDGIGSQFLCSCQSCLGWYSEAGLRGCWDIPSCPRACIGKPGTRS